MKIVLTVDVTQDDINNGVAGDPWGCPVAMAVRRLVGESQVEVVEDEISIGGSIYSNPPEVKDFVFSFDTLGASSVDPMSFELVIEETEDDEVPF
jgi:hypothetical protein